MPWTTVPAPSPAIILGAGLVVLAAALAVRPRNAEPAAPPAPAAGSPKFRNRPGATPSGTRVSELVATARTTPFERRAAWAASLDDDELRRLARELFHQHLAAGDDPAELAPWLCTLSMESGKRDLAAFESLIDESMAAESRGNPEGVPDLDALGLASACTRAAIAGLAEIDPAGAWSRVASGGSADSRTLVDFVHFSGAPVPRSLLAETVLRHWGRRDPGAAWAALQQEGTRMEPAALRGLLATSDDPGLADRVLGWLDEHAAKPAPGWTTHHPGDPFGEPDGLREGGEAISRNSIDAILNNPNRSAWTIDRARTQVLAGLAERDPALAWERARAIDDLHADSPDPFAGVPEAAAGMLEAWSARDPEAALAFLADDARDRVAPGHWSAVLESLAAFDPVRSLELATAADSEGGTLRLSVLGHIRRAGDVSPAWPLFADLPSPLTGEARHAELTRVVSLLGGDADEEARWIVWLESDDPFAAPPIALPDPCLAR